MLRNNSDRENTDDNVSIKVHSLKKLKAQVDNWDNLSRKEKLEVVRETEPDKEITDHNTTVDGLNKYLVDNLHESQTVDEDVTHLQIGSDGSGGTSTGDTSVNSPINTYPITDSQDQGKDLFTSTFIDSSQANGNDIEECGLTTAGDGGTFLNHSTFQAIPKDNTKTLTIDVTLQFRAD